jgi:hypothetical protein
VIRTSDLRFMRRSPQSIELPLKNTVELPLAFHVVSYALLGLHPGLLIHDAQSLKIKCSKGKRERLSKKISNCKIG